MASKRKKKAKKRVVVHLLHHRFQDYFHTYCGFVNFVKKKPWNFTRSLNAVTCKRCLASIEKDGGEPVTFTKKLREWAKKFGG